MYGTSFCTFRLSIEAAAGPVSFGSGSLNITCDISHKAEYACGCVLSRNLGPLDCLIKLSAGCTSLQHS